MNTEIWRIAMPLREPSPGLPSSLFPAQGTTSKDGLRGFDLTEKDLPDSIKAKARQHLVNLEVTPSKAKRNLMDLLENASPEHRRVGASWYQDAHDEGERFARAHDIHPDVYHGIVAMLSPGTEWGHNVKTAQDLIENGDINSAAYKGYPLQLEKAKYLLESTKGHPNPIEEVDKQLGGNKVRSFFNNLADPVHNGNDVTIDTHMLRALANGFTEDKKVGKRLVHIKEKTNLSSSPSFQGASLGLHPFASDAVRSVTKTFNKRHGTSYSPMQVQAIIWSHQKDLYPQSRLNELTKAYRGSLGTGRRPNPGSLGPMDPEDIF